MISVVYEALRVANVLNDEVRQKVEAVANVDIRLLSIEAKLTMMQWVLSCVGFGVLLLVIKKHYPRLRKR